MAVPLRGRRAGKIEIDNKERERKEELKKRKEREQGMVTPEEEVERMRILKEAGLLTLVKIRGL